MFSNYQNIVPNYTPNNIVCPTTVGKSYTKLDPVKASKPYEEYNIKGELIGYSWRYGETLNLEFNIDGEITVECDAVILHVSGQTPYSIYGNIGQRAYNIADQRSWTCTSQLDGYCVWVEDAEFTYDETSSRSIFVLADDYLKDKTIEFLIYNFRMEPIYSHKVHGSSKVIVTIGKELSAKLVKGVYYCSLTVFDDVMKQTIFDNHDCTLLVK